eukprot:TRINITY_DN15683_c0_g1_i22.p1 TRINITY_DN15683_c0_g1~~TRINITY_DN15683_c0_g1_i22.p1  ORF type:complete len:148 (+),score=31.87 TRINITY_DN15683_c0_g1_i22:158-601(+)
MCIRDSLCGAATASAPRCTSPVFVKDVVRLETPEAPQDVQCTGVALRLSSGAYQYAFEVMSCGVEGSAVVAEFGPCLAPWTVDLYRLPGGNGTMTVVFASKASNSTIVAECDITSMRRAVETNKRDFLVGTLRLPTWVARSLLRNFA